jgi:hypothetical protein
MEYYKENRDSKYMEIVERMVTAISLELGLDSVTIKSQTMAPTSNSNLNIPQYLKDKMVPRTEKSAIEELWEYLKADSENPEIDPMAWWRNNQCKYRKLAQIARVVMAIHATSAASERVFSGARLVMPWYRCRLDGTTLQALMCKYQRLVKGKGY